MSTHSLRYRVKGASPWEKISAASNPISSTKQANSMNSSCKNTTQSTGDTSSAINQPGLKEHNGIGCGSFSYSLEKEHSPSAYDRFHAIVLNSFSCFYYIKKTRLTTVLSSLFPSPALHLSASRLRACHTTLCPWPEQSPF